MTAGSAASRRVLARTPVAPLPASSSTRPTGITGRMSAPPETSSPEVCSFRLPQMCGFRLPLTLHIRSGGRHSQGDGAGATGTRGDRGLTTPSIGRRSVGEADVRVSSTEAWPGVTVILGPHIRGSPRRRAGRESAGHGGWCPGPVTPRRRDARPLPRVTPRPAGGDDPLETAARRQGPTPRPQAAAHHFGRHPPQVPA